MRITITLASLVGCAAGACTSTAPPRLSPVAHAAVERATYEVSFDLEYGYVFDKSGERFFPQIAESELPRFAQFFSDEHMQTMLGKRVSFYCNCEIAREGSMRRVVKADLYAR